MGDVIDIPIIPRGRIIMPGDDEPLERVIELGRKIVAAYKTLPPGVPHDGIEPLRRNVRWVLDHRPAA